MFITLILDIKCHMVSITLYDRTRPDWNRIACVAGGWIRLGGWLQLYTRGKHWLWICVHYLRKNYGYFPLQMVTRVVSLIWKSEFVLVVVCIVNGSLFPATFRVRRVSNSSVKNPAWSICPLFLRETGLFGNDEFTVTSIRFVIILKWALQFSNY